nr:YSIRK-type signal peptide-containing protein [Ipomoea batatas]
MVKSNFNDHWPTWAQFSYETKAALWAKFQTSAELVSSKHDGSVENPDSLRFWYPHPYFKPLRPRLHPRLPRTQWPFPNPPLPSWIPKTKFPHPPLPSWLPKTKFPYPPLPYWLPKTKFPQPPLPSWLPKTKFPHPPLPSWLPKTKFPHPPLPSWLPKTKWPFPHPPLPSWIPKTKFPHPPLPSWLPKTKCPSTPAVIESCMKEGFSSSHINGGYKFSTECCKSVAEIKDECSDELYVPVIKYQCMLESLNLS